MSDLVTHFGAMAFVDKIALSTFIVDLSDKIIWFSLTSNTLLYSIIFILYSLSVFKLIALVFAEKVLNRPLFPVIIVTLIS